MPADGTDNKWKCREARLNDLILLFSKFAHEDYSCYDT